MDGQEGLEYLETKLKCICKTVYKVIFVDLNMPVLNGVDMMRKLH
jgi:CheY-like chemotaxis protein